MCVYIATYIHTYVHTYVRMSIYVHSLVAHVHQTMHIMCTSTLYMCIHNKMYKLPYIPSLYMWPESESMRKTHDQGPMTTSPALAKYKLNIVYCTITAACWDLQQITIQVILISTSSLKWYTTDNSVKNWKTGCTSQERSLDHNIQDLTYIHTYIRILSHGSCDSIPLL